MSEVSEKSIEELTLEDLEDLCLKLALMAGRMNDKGYRKNQQKRYVPNIFKAIEVIETIGKKLVEAEKC